MLAAKFIIFALLLIACSYGSPLQTTTVYGSPLFIVPLFVQDFKESQPMIDEEPIYALNDDSKIEARTASFNIEKRSAETIDDDDLETAAGTNLFRPLFVYRQQVAYRQRLRDAIRRDRRIASLTI